MSRYLITSTDGPGRQVEVTPESAGWTYLDFAVEQLEPGGAFATTNEGRETAIVPIAGSGTVVADGQSFAISRGSVFTDMPEIVYVTPGQEMTVTAGADGFQFSIGSAPAEGRYPTRLIGPGEVKAEVRGGGASYRQVNHVLAPPVEAERLILYEVYVPRGTWSGWAPHRHDGVDGSPYLEEVYWFRLDREGFAMHRNWAPEADYDDMMILHDGDVALVPKGYHSSVACPSTNMYFLNYLAGELQNDERVTPPCFHADHTWIQDDWDAGAWTQPVIEAPNLGKQM